jgi:hypothetical protein
MKFQIVGHACLSVEAAGKRLVVDPWIQGSVYWDAWWHCPDPVLDDGIFRADFIYITHWHFDHIHRESLERFDKGCHVLLAKFPVSSLPAQMRAMGFTRITEIEHGRPFAIAPSFSITSFQIQYQDDSLCVIEADGRVLVDLNDAKPLPRTWKRLQRRYPHVDFMLRSHSPAWSYPSAYTFDDPAGAVTRIVRATMSEIIAQAQQLGTFPISIIPDQDCCTLFTPRHPATRARVADATAAEQALPIDEMVDGAVQAASREEFRYPMLE